MYEYRRLTPIQQQEIVQERLKKQLPLHRPPHLDISDTYYLLTGTCYEHVPHLTIPRRQQLGEMLLNLCEQNKITVYAWVILPNHYHILVYIPDKTKLSNIFQKTHGKLAYLWNKEEQKQGRKIWYQYNDTIIKSESHFYTAFNYIHYNPVKHQIVNSPYDWLDSSLQLYVEQKGKEWLRELWKKYPVHNFGVKWDD